MMNKAVTFTAGVLRYASDWQEGQTALFEDDELGAWLLEEAGGDEEYAITLAESIVRKAEERLGSALPY